MLRTNQQRHARPNQDEGIAIEFGRGNNHSPSKKKNVKSPSSKNTSTRKAAAIAVAVGIALTLLLVVGLSHFRQSTTTNLKQSLPKPDLPKDWQSWTFQRFQREFPCAHRPSSAFELYTVEDFQMMRDTYIQYVDRSYKFDDLVPPTEGYSLHVKGTPPPYHAEKIPDGPRGLFASRDIHKGELVHNGTKSDVSFPDANAWRRFMFGLHKREMGCDVTEWAWTQGQVKNGPLKLMTSFTISILINEGMTDEDINVLPESNVSPLFYATRDIKKGEELLTTYETLYYTNHDAVGLMWG
eukprot:scaffold4110_cov77-Skeletonema_dohrnii-CCMP3373.AAC.9